MRNQGHLRQSHGNRPRSLSDVNDACNHVPRTELISARSSRPLSSAEENRDISPRSILRQLRTQNTMTVLENHNGQMAVPAWRSQKVSCETKRTHTKKTATKQLKSAQCVQDSQNRVFVSAKLKTSIVK
jgi:hypothetical protein